MGIRLIVLLFLDENICCGYSLEAPRRGASNEYPQHMFSLGNKKNIDTFWLKKAPYQELWILPLSGAMMHNCQSLALFCL